MEQLHSGLRSCNSRYKRNFFPLKVEPSVAPAEGDEAVEDALLLNPFGHEDPIEHLQFDVLGIVGPRGQSKYGLATIQVCGLDRRPLERKRGLLAQLLQLQLDVFSNPNASQEVIDLSLKSIAHLGRADKEHCGMVRGMFTDSTGLDWSYVEDNAPLPEPTF